jgi:hypothetical protein
VLYCYYHDIHYDVLVLLMLRDVAVAADAFVLISVYNHRVNQ